MVDGVLLLVDASEGPLPQTRFVLRKALEARLPVILVVNKVGPPGRARRGGRRRGLRAVHRPRRRRAADRLPDRLLQRQGRASPSLEYDPDRPLQGSPLQPLLDLLLEHIPAPAYDPEHPLQALVTNLDASPYVGRLAICRVRHGTIRKGAADRVVSRRRHASSAPRSPSCTSPTRSSASTPPRPGRAKSSPSPASPRSRSARRSRTPTTRARCR